MGVKHDMVEKAGAWYSYGGERIGQGKANSSKYLAEHPEMAKELDGRLRAELLANKVDKKDDKKASKKESKKEAATAG